MRILRLRTRLLGSGLVAVVLVISLVTFVLIERRNYTEQIAQLAQLQRATAVVRELSLYTQYAAYDTNAYALGHLEHRQEYAKHAAACTAIGRQYVMRYPPRW